MNMRKLTGKAAILAAAMAFSLASGAGEVRKALNIVNFVR